MKDDLEITGKTQLYCLLGSPVTHSGSPKMHNEAFHRLGVDACYLAFDVTEKTLPAAVEGLRALGARGWNLTMPCKTAMAALCDELTPAARLSGSVNTVANRGGRLIGTTTDGAGWVRVARDRGFSVEGQRLVVLGAGGAGKSVMAQCALSGAARIDVFQRKSLSWDAAAAFAERVSGNTDCKVILHDSDDAKSLWDAANGAALLLNATSVGMASNPGCPLRDVSLLREGLIVSDLIYEPRETELLRLARIAGCEAFNGADMLRRQGEAAFAFWTGQEMPGTEKESQ